MGPETTYRDCGNLLHSQEREASMMNCRSKQIILTAIVLTAALPGAAFAGDNGSGSHAAGGSKPSENMSLNYTKIEHNYTQQSASKKNSGGAGKTKFNDFSVTRKTDKASP
jgi:hypothetical protein